jgi:hypothetical protein
MNVYPFNDVLAQADSLLANPNTDVYQQFQCGTCGMKQTMDVPNTFYTTGKCEVCGGITDLKANWCNFMTVSKLR